MGASIAFPCFCVSRPISPPSVSAGRSSATFGRANSSGFWRRRRKGLSDSGRQAFLDLIWRAYRRLVGREWNGTDPGRVVALIDIHDTLTLLPGSDYPQEEFARDLLLLDRRPDLRTRGGERFEFPHGTTTKGIKPLIVYDEQGSRTGLLRHPVRPGRVRWRTRRYRSMRQLAHPFRPWSAKWGSPRKHGLT